MNLKCHKDMANTIKSYIDNKVKDRKIVHRVKPCNKVIEKEYFTIILTWLVILVPSIIILMK